MKKSVFSALVALPLLSIALAGPVLAADSPTTPVVNAKADDYAVGQKAITAKNWTLAG